MQGDEAWGFEIHEIYSIVHDLRPTRLPFWEASMRVRIVLAFVFLSAGVASAQTTITIAPSPARRGQAITVSGMPCANAKPTVMFDAGELQTTAGSDANTFQVATTTLTPRSYRVTMHCGTAISKEATLEIVAAPPAAPDTPTVTCVENLTPRDGWKCWRRVTLRRIMTTLRRSAALWRHC